MGEAQCCTQPRDGLIPSETYTVRIRKDRYPERFLNIIWHAIPVRIDIQPNLERWILLSLESGSLRRIQGADNI